MPHSLSVKPVIGALLMLGVLACGKQTTKPSPDVEGSKLPRSEISVAAKPNSFIEQNIENYLTSLEFMVPGRLLTAERTEGLVPAVSLDALMEEGRFAFHKKLVAALHRDAGLEFALQDAVVRAGFSSLEEWAEVADFVSNAIYAARDDGQCVALRAQMLEMANAPEQLSEEVVVAMNTANVLCDIVDMIPAEEAEALKPHMARLRALDEQLKSGTVSQRGLHTG